MKHFFFFAVLLFCVTQTSASEKDFNEQETRFISELFRKNRYFDCIAEARKLQNRDNKPEIDYFIYSNYYLAGQYASVIRNYSPEDSSAEMRFPSTLLLSYSYLNQGHYSESYNILQKLDYSMIPEKYFFPMFLRRVEPLLLSGDMEKLQKEIGGSEIFLKDSYNFAKLREELQMYEKDGLKTPAFAAVISAILPGLGQCYSGFPVEGLISLLAVAATAGGGFYMKEKGEKGFSCTLFFFSGLFYSGNIYGAYRSAEYKNNQTLQKWHGNIITGYGAYNPAEYFDMEKLFH